MTDTAMATRRFWQGFWGVILLGVAALMLAAIVVAVRGPARHEIAADAFDKMVSQAGREAVDAVVIEFLDPALDRVFAPVRAGIPAYADFHYTVLGEYTELAEAVLGRVSSGVQDKMFAGFDARLQAEMAGLDTQLVAAYVAAINGRLEALRASLANPDVDFGPVTQKAIADAQARFAVTLPVGLMASAAVTGGAAKAATAGMAKALVKKIAAKTTAKAAGKLGATIAGGGAGALACSWAGPVAVACGAAAGIAAWFAVDAAIVRLDEVFTRPDFEAELCALVAEFQANLRARAIAALEAKTLAFDAGTATLRDQAAQP